MPGSSRQHRGEKRRKELVRKERQEVKRQRKAEKRLSGTGGGPPIDWEASEAGRTLAGDSGPQTAPGESQDVKES
jgi:hypothetical protein